MERWREYGEGLYCEDNHTSDDTADPPTPDWPVILECEVEDAIKKLPKRKVPGYDEIPAELYKTDNRMLIKVMCKLCNEIVKRGEWPSDWVRSIFVPIAKTTGATECSNFRTIALISSDSHEEDAEDSRRTIRRGADGI